MKLLSSDNNSGMLLKNPKGLISKGTQMYKITSGTSFAGLTQFPVFEIVSFDDSSTVTKLSNTKIQLTANKKYKMTCEGYGDGSAVQQFGFYNVTNSEFVGNMGVGAGLTTSIKAELIIRPTVTTEIEVRPIATSTFTTQQIWNTYVEEVESNVNDTAQAIKQMTKVYNTVVDMQSAMGLKLGDVIETLGYTTKNDGLGRKYIITATDVDNLNILVNGKYASKFNEKVYNSELLNGENKATMFTSPTFTGAPTASTPANSDSSTNISTTAFVKNVGLGWGHTWQDMTSKRAIGTTYTNTTGKPIFVYVDLFTSNAQYGTLNINGIDAGFSVGGTNANECSVSFVIPSGNTYSIGNGNGISFRKWLELR